ncbi:alanyl-tRNA editing protein [Candidatus Woesearchaeota archaeon]|nr:alanyl-tRNA editing protein [Candidatus Woesearchaeota archaeon]
MTELLYLEDSYLREFEAIIIEVNNDKYVVLDKTAFYFHSGGQPNDTGKIICNNVEYNVVYVAKVNGNVSHEVDKEGLKVGDKIKGVINWERRYKLMRMHTAAHVLNAIFFNELGAIITGNQKDLEKSRMDFNLENYNIDEIKKKIEKANEEIKKDLKVKSYYLSKDEVMKNPSLHKLAKNIEDRDVYRILEIEGLDTQCDGGTHVKSLKEVGEIIFIKAENKGKNNRRVYFGLRD